MLHKNPELISVETFSLIQQLQALPMLNEFHLIGGTALTLQLGHRHSIDIYFLLNYFSLEMMLKFFQVKYPNTNPLIPLKAVNYFDDIDESIDPPKLLKPLKLDEIKKRIRDATLNPKKIY